jgi:putative NADH-flavin reductase
MNPVERKLKLTILAATGGIGRQLLEQAVDAGHDVTAVVRSSKRLSRPVRTVVTDLASPDRAALESAVRGADAVLSGLGARSAAEAGVAWRGTLAVTQAMKAVGVRRIVVVSAAPIGTVPSPGRPKPPKYDPGDGFLMRHLLSPLTKVVLRAHYADLARMEDVLRESGLDWTVVRPPQLTHKAWTGEYAIAYGQNLRVGFSVSRADVADFMLRAISQQGTVHQAMGIASQGRATQTMPWQWHTTVPSKTR